MTSNLCLILRLERIHFVSHTHPHSGKLACSEDTGVNGITAIWERTPPAPGRAVSVRSDVVSLDE